MREYVYMVLEVLSFIAIITFDRVPFKVIAGITLIVVTILWKKDRLKDNERGEVR